MGFCEIVSKGVCFLGGDMFSGSRGDLCACLSITRDWGGS